MRYLLNGQVLYTEVVRCMNDAKTDVTANTKLFDGAYVLDGPDTVSVYVTADGTPQPSTVDFYLAEESWPEPEPEPEPEPYYPPTPSGSLGNAFPAYVSATLTNPPLLAYLGPGENYYRTTSGVYLSGKARIYGKDGQWLMIAYKTEADSYRIGYVRDYKLAKGVDANSIPELTYAYIGTTLTKEASVTEAPETQRKASETLPAGTRVTFLAWLYEGSEWVMIEYQSPKYGQTVRAFVKGNLLACMQ